MNLYNEIEPYAADWLENLIGADLVAPGAVDRRSIADLREGDLHGITQAHFFAGIGVWSGALRAAGWPDDVPVWTGSCPCQPFSSAGRGGGTADDRHLWPMLFNLIKGCRPPVIFGEQVASKAGLGWLDLVLSDLEGAGYSCRAFDLAAASVGAPHIRQRLYFVAVAKDLWRGGLANNAGNGWRQGSAQRFGSRDRELQITRRSRLADQGDVDELADDHEGRWRELQTEPPPRHQQPDFAGRGDAVLLGHPGGPGGRRDPGAISREEAESQGPGYRYRRLPDELVPAGATRSHWAPADWLLCTDGKARPTEPSVEPLAHGSPTRVGPGGTLETQPRTARLKGYGNAIVKQVATAFIQAVMETLDLG